MSKSDILQNEFARDFRRGLLKMFILKMLKKEDMHGYAMMTRIENVSGWKTSPGSLYPALLNLSTQGLIRMKVLDMKKVYSITKKGEEYVTILEGNFGNGLKEIQRIFDEL